MNLAWTGIEYPFMKERPKFKEITKEFEPIHCMNVTFLQLINVAIARGRIHKARNW